MSIRIEQFDGGEVLYIALDPDGAWARSEFPDELVTVDYDVRGAVIGIEILGSLAQQGAEAVLDTLVGAGEMRRDAVVDALSPLTGA